MTQQYSTYTQDDFEVWKILFNRQIKQLQPLASKAYLQGIKDINFSPDKIPNYQEVNELLMELTGWQIHVVPGLIDNKPFFKVRCLLDKKQLHLNNGFTGDLKKGMTLQARFLVNNSPTNKMTSQGALLPISFQKGMSR